VVRFLPVMAAAIGLPAPQRILIENQQDVEFVRREFVFEQKMKAPWAQGISFVQLFDLLLKRFEERNIVVEKICLYGSQLIDVLVGKHRVHKDIDFLVRLQKNQNPYSVKEVYFQVLSELLGIHERSALDALVVCPNAIISTVPNPTCQLDITLCWDDMITCTRSSNSFQADILPYLRGQRSLLSSVESVEGYDFRRSIELVEQRLFYIVPGHPSKLRDGLKSYIHAITIGELPVDFTCEAEFLEKWLQEYPTPERKQDFLVSIRKHLNKHYGEERVFRTAFLWTLRTFFISKSFDGQPEWIQQLDEFKASIIGEQRSALLYWNFGDAQSCFSVPGRMKVQMGGAQLLIEPPWRETVDLLDSEHRNYLMPRLAHSPVPSDPVGKILVYYGRGESQKAAQVFEEIVDSMAMIQKLGKLLNQPAVVQAALVANLPNHPTKDEIDMLVPSKKLLERAARLPELPWGDDWLGFIEQNRELLPTFVQCASFPKALRQEAVRRLLRAKVAFDSVWLTACETGSLPEKEEAVVVQFREATTNEIKVFSQGLIRLFEVNAGLAAEWTKVYFSTAHPLCLEKDLANSWRLLQLASARPVRTYTLSVQEQIDHFRTIFKPQMQLQEKLLRDESLTVDHRAEFIEDLWAFCRLVNPEVKLEDNQVIFSLLIDLLQNQIPSRQRKALTKQVSGITGRAFPHVLEAAEAPFEERLLALGKDISPKLQKVYAQWWIRYLYPDFSMENPNSLFVLLKRVYQNGHRREILPLLCPVFSFNHLMGAIDGTWKEWLEALWLDQKNRKGQLHWMLENNEAVEKLAKTVQKDEVSLEDAALLMEWYSDVSPAVIDLVLKNGVKPERALAFLQKQISPYAAVSLFEEYRCDGAMAIEIAFEIKRLEGKDLVEPTLQQWKKMSAADLPMLRKIIERGANHKVVWKAAATANQKNIAFQMEVAAICPEAREEVEDHFVRTLGEKIPETDFLKIFHFVALSKTWKATKHRWNEPKMRGALIAKVRESPDPSLNFTILAALCKRCSHQELGTAPTELFIQNVHRLDDASPTVLWTALQPILKMDKVHVYIPPTNKTWNYLCDPDHVEAFKREKDNPNMVGFVATLLRQLRTSSIWFPIQKLFAGEIVIAVGLVDAPSLSLKELEDLAFDLIGFPEVLTSMLHRIEYSQDHAISVALLARIANSIHPSEVIRAESRASFRRKIAFMTNLEPESFWSALTPLMQSDVFCQQVAEPEDWQLAFATSSRQFDQCEDKEKLIRFLHAWTPILTQSLIWSTDALGFLIAAFKESVEKNSPEAQTVWLFILEAAQKTSLDPAWHQEVGECLKKTADLLTLTLSPQNQAAFERMKRPRPTADSVYTALKASLTSPQFEEEFLQVWADIIHVNWDMEDYGHLLSIVREVGKRNRSLALMCTATLYTEFGKWLPGQDVMPQGLIQSYHHAAMEYYLSATPLLSDEDEQKEYEYLDAFIDFVNCSNTDFPDLPLLNVSQLNHPRRSLLSLVYDLHATILYIGAAKNSEPPGDTAPYQKMGKDLLALLTKMQFFRFFQLTRLNALFRSLHLLMLTGANPDAGYMSGQVLALMKSPDWFTEIEANRKAQVFDRFCLDLHVIPAGEPSQKMRGILCLLDGMSSRPSSEEGSWINRAAIQYILADFLLQHGNQSSIELSLECAEDLLTSISYYYVNPEEFSRLHREKRFLNKGSLFNAIHALVQFSIIENITTGALLNPLLESRARKVKQILDNSKKLSSRKNTSPNTLVLLSTKV
jgi:hypothetical protein